MNNLNPAEVFPPGEILRDELEARNWSQVEFAGIISRPHRLVSEIVNGKRGVSPDTAMDFAAALGTSAQFWLNLETAYQLFKASLDERSGRDEQISRKAALHSNYPIRELLKNNWVEDSESYEVLEGRVLDYYGVSSIDDTPQMQMAAKRTAGEVTDLSDSQVAWLYRVKNLADGMAIPKYSNTKLRAAIDSLETLLTEPEEIRHVPEILRKCGVKYVVVEPSKGSKICGVCFWTNDNKTPVIGMTLLLDRLDNFWFVLRHEIEHVLRGDGKQEAVVDEKADDGTLTSRADSVAENAANEAAANFCVPQADMDKYIARVNPIFSEKSLLGFARRTKRHPGLVVGQLHFKTQRWKLFRGHLPKVRHIVISTALCDGYGVSTT